MQLMLSLMQLVSMNNNKTAFKPNAAGAELNIKDNDGQTALDIAKAKAKAKNIWLYRTANSSECVRLLREARPDSVKQEILARKKERRKKRREQREVVTLLFLTFMLKNYCNHL